jgi:hypothetical protein
MPLNSSMGHASNLITMDNAFLAILRQHWQRRQDRPPTSSDAFVIVPFPTWPSRAELHVFQRLAPDQQDEDKRNHERACQHCATPIVMSYRVSPHMESTRCL